MRFLLAVSFCLVLNLAQAAEFDIYQSGYRPLNLAWLSSGDETAAESSEIYKIVKHDLDSSHSFTTLSPLSFLPSAESVWTSVEYADWRIIGADVLAFSQLRKTSTGWEAKVEVHDPFQRKQLGATTIISKSSKKIRYLAHEIANYIYKTVTDVPGHFNTQILFVQKRGLVSDLVYMDQDGYNRQPVGRNFTLLLSPDWSPDNSRVALNTYVGNRPRVEIFNLRDGGRDVIGSFPGLNSTPEFSPDGRYIVATLSYTGNSELHLFDLKTRTWKQLTHHPDIDTTPSWSPDGKWIAFTSNRSGEPQIYRMNVDSGEVLRVTHKANYNTSPSWSPLGDKIALVTLKNWEYAIATVNIDGSDVRYLATGKRVESPTWSPNGQMILFSAETKGVRQIYRVPSWGGPAEAITSMRMDASDPAWSK